MPQIDPELSIKICQLKVFLVFDAISVHFPRFRSKFQHSQINNARTSYALHFLKRTLQRFASNALQNDSKAVEKFRYLRFRANSVLFESFCSQNIGKGSTKTGLIIQKAFKGILADFGWRLAQN